MAAPHTVSISDSTPATERACTLYRRASVDACWCLVVSLSCESRCDETTRSGMSSISSSIASLFALSSLVKRATFVSSSATRSSSSSSASLPPPTRCSPGTCSSGTCCGAASYQPSRTDAILCAWRALAKSRSRPCCSFHRSAASAEMASTSSASMLSSAT